MGNDSAKGDLSLDSYIKQLKDYKDKAEKVFAMGSPNPSVNYVISALDYAIQVAQGKGVISDEEKQAVILSAAELTKSAMQFHSKFAQVRQQIEGKAENSDEEVQNTKPGGLNMQ